MRERFNKLKAGDRLSARRMNRIGRVVERFARFKTGGGMASRHTGSSVNIAGGAPWNQFAVEVSDTKIDANDTDDSGLYLVKIRWYSHYAGVWVTEDKEWNLDANGLDQAYNVGEKLVAYWDEQRGMFVPVSIGGGLMVVNCAKDGGVAGSASQDCTFTYTVSSLSGTVLGTLLTPERARYPLCAYLPGDGLGLAALVSGTLRLLVAWKEIEDTTTCEEEESSSSSSLSESQSSVSSESSESSVHSSASSASSGSSLSSVSTSSSSSASWESHSSLSSLSSPSSSSSSGTSSSSPSSSSWSSQGWTGSGSMSSLSSLSSISSSSQSSTSSLSAPP